MRTYKIISQVGHVTKNAVSLAQWGEHVVPTIFQDKETASAVCLALNKAEEPARFRYRVAEATEADMVLYKGYKAVRVRSLSAQTKPPKAKKEWTTLATLTGKGA